MKIYLLALMLVVLGGCVEQPKIPASEAILNVESSASDVNQEKQNQEYLAINKDTINSKINESRDSSKNDLIQDSFNQQIDNQDQADHTQKSIQEKQALEKNPALRCTDYYEVYMLYFLDIKQELKDFQQRYLDTVENYERGRVDLKNVEKAEWKMKEKEAVYLKVQDSFRRLNGECSKTYEFDDISDLFIEVK